MVSGNAPAAGSNSRAVIDPSPERGCYRVRVRRLAAAILLALGSAALPACALHRAFTRDEIQTELSHRFPIEQTAGPFMAEFHDPVLRLDGRGNRAALSLGVMAGGIGVPTIAGRVEVEGTVEYKSDQGAFYLRDPSVKKWDFAGIPIEAEVATHIAVETALRIVLKDRPVHVLDPKRDDREALMKAHLRRLWVEDDRIVIEYGL
jgi:hypothetical protein